ncbi:hypothetical protein [Phytoactinopolyspora mesophila]|uniref:Molybdenum ABC transporter substrate-binding protein n=1 Tax=Phytoactinopolyspora mesophila TaxID=2650750 RepID=A0A7K3M7Q9_9ACTN|nr:hypothetical protein [Phytoactinopolyspora mesophila]NDL58428.1 hypothetical protein [Phytoactinopolyspora mesophila]
MTRMTRFTALAAAVAIALPLASCGGDADYCDTVQDVMDEYQGFGVDDPADSDGINELASSIEDIADAAPDDIESDWRVTADALRTLADMDDPEVLDPETQQQFEEAQPSFDNISQHVMDECDIDLA